MLAGPIQHTDAARELPRLGVVNGVVTRGQQLGRQLGFPTANVALHREDHHRFGVYATYSTLQDGRRIAGVANIGCNPTTGLVLPRLEVFLFNFDEDIYDQWLSTDLIAFIRPELKFDGLASLSDQIARDVVEAQHILGWNLDQDRPGQCD
jgi:riboflavin kinase/FMN adenylyltransferase